MQAYASEQEALRDVLRLAKGMSYKNALADLPLGGGKCVIMADPRRPEKPDLLRAFAAHVQSLAGRYWTAIDVGVGPADADILAERCKYVFARASQYEPGFNPSAFTALGGLMGIRAVADVTFGQTDLRGLRVAIQGLGATGFALAERLHEAGVALVVADVQKAAAQRAVEAFGATALDPARIHAAEVDVFAPCALGGGLNDRTIPEIRAKAICGLANNQLAEDRHGESLRQAGIAYVPDYVVNAGGMMGASTVIFSTPSRHAAIERIEGLQPTIRSILRRAKSEDRSTAALADAMARERLEQGGS